MSFVQRMKDGLARDAKLYDDKLRQFGQPER